MYGSTNGAATASRRLVSSNGNRRQLKNMGQASSRFQVAATQRLAHVVELISIFRRKIRGPLDIGYDERDLYFSNIFTFMNEPGVLLLRHSYFQVKPVKRQVPVNRQAPVGRPLPASIIVEADCCVNDPDSAYFLLKAVRNG
jgi:hypothetical protein